jgi:hypothetical protein
LITTNLHWLENGELHPDDLERLRERLLADVALNQTQQRDREGWVIEKRDRTISAA